jgi:hypothetical protein
VIGAQQKSVLSVTKRSYSLSFLPLRGVRVGTTRCMDRFCMIVCFLRITVLPRDAVTVDGVWIGNRIYWTL